MSYLREAAETLVKEGMSLEGVELLSVTVQRSVLRDSKMGPAVLERRASPGELKMWCVEQAEGHLSAGRYPQALLPHVRHFAVQLANALLRQ